MRGAHSVILDCTSVSMVRVLTTSTLALAALASSVQAYDKFTQAGFALASGRPADAANNFTCGATTVEITHPPSTVIAGASLVLNVTAFDLPANSLVAFSACSSTAGASAAQVVNVSDSTTWVVSVPGQCVSFKLDSTKTPLDCTRAHNSVTVEYSLLSDYCARGPSSPLCVSKKDDSTTATTTKPATSGVASIDSVAWALAVAAIATITSML